MKLLEEDHVGWVKSNGCGEIIFRQAAHPGNETEMPALGWKKVYLGVEEEPKKKVTFSRGFAHDFDEPCFCAGVRGCYKELDSLV